MVLALMSPADVDSLCTGYPYLGQLGTVSCFRLLSKKSKSLVCAEICFRPFCDSEWKSPSQGLPALRSAVERKSFGVYERVCDLVDGHLGTRTQAASVLPARRWRPGPSGEMVEEMSTLAPHPQTHLASTMRFNLSHGGHQCSRLDASTFFCSASSFINAACELQPTFGWKLRASVDHANSHAMHVADEIFPRTHMFRHSWPRCDVFVPLPYVWSYP